MKAAWIAILAIAVTVGTMRIWRANAATYDTVHGCDTFGYLQMAQDLRQANVWRVSSWPDFSIHANQTDTLIAALTEAQQPSKNWTLAVGPHAYHYIDSTRRVSVQYPPGTGLALSLFKEGTSVRGLNRSVAVLLLLTTLGCIYLCYKYDVPSVAGLFAFAAMGIFVILDRIADQSFSVNAVLWPFATACCLSVLATRPWQGFVSGAFAGLSVWIRIPTLFSLPGLFFLTRKEARLAFAAGFVSLGVLPLAVHQSRVAGAWYRSTYAAADTGPPTLAMLLPNIQHYLLGGVGSHLNWLLLGAGLAILSGLGKQRRETLLAVSIWALPLAYFITHAVSVPYYTYPGLVGLTWAVAAAGLRFAKKGEARPGRAPIWAYVPGIAALVIATSFFARPLPVDGPPPTTPALPLELQNPRAWIWADEVSGNFWHFYKRAAFKPHWATSPSKEIIYREPIRRGEPQFAVLDSPAMETFTLELAKAGARINRRSVPVLGYPYAEILF